MIYRTRLPAPPIAECVDYFWYLSDAPAHPSERVVPSGTLELVINLHEDEFRIYDPADPDRRRTLSGAMVSGAYRGSFGIDTREHASILGVHFHPGGAAPMLGVPPGELSGRHVDLEAIWGAESKELREKLCDAPTLDRRFQLLEEALAARLRSKPPLHGAVRIALDQLDQERKEIGAVVSSVSLSHRRFIEVFEANVGLTPKVYARVRRFQRAMALSVQEPRLDWAMLALESGYFDQSHMIRDFVSFAGFSPEALLRQRSGPVKENHFMADSGSSVLDGAAVPVRGFGKSRIENRESDP